VYAWGGVTPEAFPRLGGWPIGYTNLKANLRAVASAKGRLLAAPDSPKASAQIGGPSIPDALIDPGGLAGRQDELPELTLPRAERGRLPCGASACDQGRPRLYSGGLCSIERNAMSERIGDYMIRTGAMNQSQVDDVVRAKTTGDKRHFGDIAVSLGFITMADVEAFLTGQK
jgi:hypothetical protein